MGTCLLSPLRTMQLASLEQPGTGRVPAWLQGLCVLRVLKPERPSLGAEQRNGTEALPFGMISVRVSESG